MIITLEILEERLGKVEKTVDRMDNTLNLVYTALRGNELDPNGGAMKRVEGIEERVKSLEKYRNEDKWIRLIVVAAIAMILLLSWQKIIAHV